MHRSSFCALIGALALVTSCGGGDQAESGRHRSAFGNALSTSAGDQFVGWGSDFVGEARAVDTRGAIAIAAGATHTVALKIDGTVVAWGNNCWRQTNVPTTLPAVTAIAAGSDHTVALGSDGMVHAWGNNYDGQTNIPSGLSAVTAISAGHDHTLALKNDGTVVAWGADHYGQSTVPPGLSGVTAISGGHLHSLAVRDGAVVAWGDDSAGQSTVPADVSDVFAVAAGFYHSVALKTDGTVAAWGSNMFGQTTIPSGLYDVVAIAAAGNHSVALKRDGTVVAWGRNDRGQSNVPPGLSGVVAIAAGDYHTVALRSDGSIAGWGFNLYGQTSSGAGGTRFAAVAGGYSHTIALRADGTVAAWGENGSGQANVPSELSGVTRIASGHYHSLALKSDGTVVAWGANEYGQSSAPAGLSRVVAVGGGEYHTLALKDDGTVVAWGGNGSGQTAVPMGLTGVTAIAAGGSHSVALGSGGTVSAWGSNTYRQSDVPVGLSGVIAISAGCYHSLALKDDGTVVAWGAYGQKNVPAGLSGVTAIAAGCFHSIALKADGTVVAWGSNDRGQTNVPAGLSGVSAIAAGAHHNVALRLAEFPIVVAWSGSGSGTVTGDRIACGPGSPEACIASLREGTLVTLTAVPEAGSHFAGWSGACTNGVGDCVVTMEAAKNVTARFEPDVPASYGLELRFAGSGNGTLWSNDFRCRHVAGSGGFCLDTAAQGETVNIEAVPDANTHFTGWSGACEGTAPLCAVVMNEPKSVTASFEPGPTVALTVRASGGTGGTVTGPYGIHPVSVGPTISSTAHVPVTSPATTVTLTAMPAAGNLVSDWSGCTALSADKRTCTVAMSYARAVSVTFRPSHYLVTARTSGLYGAAQGTITSADTDPAIACAANSGNCVSTAPNGAMVALTADVPAGSLLASWTGCTTVSADKRTCSALMTMARTVVATFQPARYPVTVRTTGLYGATQGTIASADADPAIACAANTGTCVSTAPNGATVALTADVPAGSLLASWTGCTSVSADKRTCSVAMTAAKTVTANYQSATYVLTAKTATLYGAAQGTINSLDLAPAIACAANAGTCTAAVPNGQAVTLVADVPESSILTSWSGCSSVSADKRTCTVAMTAARTVTANFQHAGYLLTAKTSTLYGAAQGTVISADTDPGIACTAGTGTCSGIAPNGATVTLFADVPESSILTSWTGCASVSADKRFCTVAMTMARTVTANFQQAGYVLTARTSTLYGAAQGTLTSVGTEPAIACTAGAGTCSGTAPNGSTVTLFADVPESSILTSWSGCSSVSADKRICAVAMTMARTVTANFQQARYPLTVRTSGIYGAAQGAITSNSYDTDPTIACAANTGTCSGYAPNGATVTLMAHTPAGSLLTGWTGCATVPDVNVCTVSMTMAKTVTANFQPRTYPLTARASGSGIGRIETLATEPNLFCGTGPGTWTCTGAAPNRGWVTLRAIPEPGSFISAWSGCTTTSPDLATCQVEMTMARTVSATFTPTAYPLTARTAGTGRGTVSTPDTEPDLACTANAGACSGTAPTGSTATLTAAPEAGSVVSGWTGCTSVSSDKATCTVSVTAARYVTATFGVAVAAP